MKVSVSKELSLLSQSVPVRGLGSGFPLAVVAGESPACCRCDPAMKPTIRIIIILVNALSHRYFKTHRKARSVAGLGVTGILFAWGWGGLPENGCRHFPVDDGPNDYPGIIHWNYWK